MRVDRVGIACIIYSMKTSAGIKIGRGTKAGQVSRIRSLGKKIAKTIDDLIVRYYYKGERLRPEVREELEQSVRDARQGKNVSPTFESAEEAIAWLESRCK